MYIQPIGSGAGPIQNPRQTAYQGRMAATAGRNSANQNAAQALKAMLTPDSVRIHYTHHVDRFSDRVYYCKLRRTLNFTTRTNVSFETRAGQYVCCMCRLTGMTRSSGLGFQSCLYHLFFRSSLRNDLINGSEIRPSVHPSICLLTVVCFLYPPLFHGRLS